MRAGRISIRRRRNTAIRRSGVWTPPPSLHWPRIRLVTECRLRFGSASTSKTTGCSCQGLRRLTTRQAGRRASGAGRHALVRSTSSPRAPPRSGASACPPIPPRRGVRSPPCCAGRLARRRRPALRGALRLVGFAPEGMPAGATHPGTRSRLRDCDSEHCSFSSVGEASGGEFWGAARCGGAAAILCDEESLGWREIELRAGGVARRLSRQGVRAGDTVALQLPNGWGFVAALWGAFKVGATVSPINPLLSAEERRKVLGHLEPALVVEEVREEEAVWDSVGATGPALVLYTPGSTGEPKGAVLSHAALRAANESWAGPVMGLVPGDIVTVLPAVATMFQRILEAPGLSLDGLGSLRLALSGAAPCPWELARQWKKRTGVRILRGYGMTELFRPISYLADDPTDLPDSIGRAVPGVEVRIMSEERSALGAGEIGELWIRTPAVLDVYLRAPEETKAVIEDGWFRTGDLATISAD